MRQLNEGERFPIGISWAINRYVPKPNKSFFLRIPLLVWKIRQYDISIDEMRHGWHVFNIVIRIDTFIAKGTGIGLRVSNGWNTIE